MGTNKLTFFLVFSFFGFIFIFFAVMLYKHFLSVFPSSVELEVPFYIISLGFILIAFFILYFLSFRSFFSNIVFKTQSQFKIKLDPILSIIIVLEISYIYYFINNSYPYLAKYTTDFRDIGVNILLDFNVGLVIIIAFLLFIFFKISLNYSTYFKKTNLLFILVMIFLIVYLSFDIKNLNDYDFAYFAGPVHDVLHGKYLLHNSPSQYGFLPIIFLSILFRFIPLGLMNLTIVNAVIVTIGFILLWILVNRLFINKLISAFTIIFLIFLNHIIQLVPDIAIIQTSFLRFGMWVVLAYCIAIKNFYSGKKYRLLVNTAPLIALTIAFFWNLDSGLYAIAAYLVYETINNLTPSFIMTFKLCLKSYFLIIIALLCGILSIEIIYKLLLHIYPDWNIYLFDPLYYLGGFSMHPLSNSTWPWILISFYLLMLVYIFLRKRFNENSLNKRDKLFMFILIYGIFQFVYFIGESHLNNLHHIIIPFVISIFYMVDIFFKKIYINNEKNNKIILIIILALLLPTCFIYVQGIENMKKYNLFHSLETIKKREIIEDNYLNRLLGLESFDLIMNDYGDYVSKNGITLVSANDSWFLIKLGMLNNIESNNLHYFTNYQQFKKIADEILKRGDRYIFIDSQMDTPGTHSVISIYNQISNKYKIIDTRGTLSVAEKIN